mmetsp:Transcript_5770/g.9731  ORF Transcript_5770/g.9731 Transcript_5770/m.9731 type:complete len:476 (+) Transcript_5770:46-1473(+)
MVQGVVVENGVIQNINPATGQLIEPAVNVTSPEELENIISAANASQPSWSDKTLSERIEAIRQGLIAVEPIGDELASVITEEMGKVSAEAKLEVSNAIGLKDGWLDMVKEANEDVHLGGGEEGKAESIVVRDPLGVVVVISPWNFPAGEIPFLAIPALAAGNTVIVKPSEVTPRSGELFCRALASSLPEGVLQVVQGDGKTGEQLISSDDIHMVAMTGSTATGKKIMNVCSKKLKRLVLELGGKDPMVVFKDADLDNAANDAVAFSLFNCGQVCCAVERVYVDESIQNEFEQKVLDVAKKYKVGNPTDADTTIGPLASQVQRENISKQVEAAVKEGAKVLYQSDCPDDRHANFYPVTVLSSLKQVMPIQNLETFGPVVAMSTFDGTEEAAIEMANSSEFGLASYVYTTDLTKGSRVARKIRSGQVGINCYSILEAQPACPWIGHKQSGFGSHSGMDGFRSFSVPKSIVFTTNAPK